MKQYKYVLEFDKSKDVKPEILKKALDYAWRYTPSKNQFMNYSVHVLGPQHCHLRQPLYYKCLENQKTANNENFTSLQEYDKYLEDIKKVPSFRNVLSAPYILIYTQRVENKLNKMQKANVDSGMVFEQTFQQGTRKYESANRNARIEVGMFSANFSTVCLEMGLDISYIGCMPLEIERWQEPEWSFITHRPMLIQLVGYGKIYKKDVIDPKIDLKPDFERVVNIL